MSITLHTTKPVLFYTNHANYIKYNQTRFFLNQPCHLSTTNSFYSIITISITLSITKLVLFYTNQANNVQGKQFYSILTMLITLITTKPILFDTKHVNCVQGKRTLITYNDVCIQI